MRQFLVTFGFAVVALALGFASSSGRKRYSPPVLPPMLPPATVAMSSLSQTLRHDTGPVLQSPEAEVADAWARIAQIRQQGLTPDGATLYAAGCVPCHQSSGMGMFGKAPPLAQNDFVTNGDPRKLASVLLYGLVGVVQVRDMVYTGFMPPVGGMADKELAELTNYIRTSWGNNAPPVPSELFLELRKSMGNRGPLLVQELTQ